MSEIVCLKLSRYSLDYFLTIDKAKAIINVINNTN